MIRLMNTKKRAFSCQLEKSPIGDVGTVRKEHDPKSGKVNSKEHSYQVYDELTILANRTSEALDESVLDNASVQGAIKDRWLKVIR